MIKRRLDKFLIRNKLKLTANLPGAKLDISNPTISDTIRGYIARNKYEAEEYNLISTSLKPEDVVLEVGAGMGYISCICGKILNDSRNLHVYEANPKLIEIIDTNKRLNGLNFHTYNALLGSYNGKSDFYIPDDFWAASMVPLNNAEKFEIDVVNIVDVMNKIKPSYLVMDIEGAEVDVLPSMDLSDIHTICLEVHPHKAQPERIRNMFSFLLDQGFMFDFNKYDLVFLFRKSPN